MASFINDVIIGMEIEKKSDEIVKECKKVNREQSICKTRKIQVEGEESRVFRSSNRARRD